MESIFGKLNLKDQKEILVLDAPRSFEGELGTLSSVRILRNINRIKKIEFALVFATTQARVDELSEQLAGRAQGDAILWFAYPKGTSKKYRCDFNRDSGWTVLRGHGFDSVRMVAIDEDWSALRFRKLEFIKVKSASQLASPTT